MAFPLFSNLPTELRIQIWRDALPEPIASSLFFYQTGEWRFRSLPESNRNYVVGHDNVIFDWYPSWVGLVRLDMPLIYVNHESHSIAMERIAKGDIQKHFPERGGHPVFGYSYKHERDAIYIGMNEWMACPERPIDHEFLSRNKSDDWQMLVPIQQLAIPVALLQHLDDEWVGDLIVLLGYCRPETLLIVVGEQPDLIGFSDESLEQARWEFEDAQHASFVWKVDESTGGTSFESHNGEISDEIKELGELLKLDLIVYNLPKFEIQKVLAVKR